MSLLRLAALADVHGNPIALDAVLADVAARGGADGFLVLGDHAALGPDPVGALQRLTALPGARLTRGNTDRYAVSLDRPPPTPAQVRADPALLSVLVDVAHSFAWTQGVLTGAGWLDRLAALPLETRLTLPDGTRVLGVHASPGRDDGPGVRPGLSDADLRALVAGAGADLVLVGHTHWPVDRTVAGVRVVNVASVGNPTVPGLGAAYVLIEADAGGYRLRFRRVGYDAAAVLAALRRVRHPAAPWIAAHYLGTRPPPWSMASPLPAAWPAAGPG
ncbi:MAG TPA: metallophosphoesterase family protein [Chloroflexota bacterium]|nr:metallophosphoesterase family protein [Chloroflexota bacterium]